MFLSNIKVIHHIRTALFQSVNLYSIFFILKLYDQEYNNFYVPERIWIAFFFLLIKAVQVIWMEINSREENQHHSVEISMYHSLWWSF